MALTDEGRRARGVGPGGPRSVVDITVLGGFAVRVDGTPVPPQAWRRRAASGVVKLLALSEGRSLHRERLADLLWPDVPRGTAIPRLHQAAHFARSALGLHDGVVLHDDLVVLLPTATVRVDATEFRRQAEEALRAGTAAGAHRVLAGYGSELLPGDLYADWAAPWRDAVETLRGRLQRLACGPPPRTWGPPGGSPAVDVAGRGRGLLLVVDDLARADPESLALLHRLAASITARGIGRVLAVG